MKSMNGNELNGSTSEGCDCYCPPPRINDLESHMPESSSIQRQGQEPASVPERELRGFVSAVSELFGNGQTSFLREIWLDELASRETMPAPASSEWRLVTLAAWARLAHRLVDADSMVHERLATWRPADSTNNRYQGMALLGESARASVES
jgi:hypothetical protein